MMGLYVHIPFCRAICTYCDFVKEVASTHKHERYMEALLKELRMIEPDLSSIETLYIGGGTPSIYPPAQLERLMTTLFSIIPRQHLVEATFECNPEDVTPLLAKTLLKAGIDRISLGVQTFDKNQLMFLNRKHRAQTSKQAVQYLRDAGFKRISIDMISGLIGQKMTDLQADLEAVLALKVDHISYYSLILEEQTRLWHLVQRRKVTLIDEDLDADMYETVVRTLTKAGYNQYEISSFAKPNQQSRHNMLYWQDEEYVGIGAGAHGRLGAVRHENIRSVKRYIESVEAGRLPRLQTVAVEGMKEALLMGLRMNQGVSLQRLEQRYHQPVLKRFPSLVQAIEYDLLEIVDGALRFTLRGRMLGNEVFEKL